MHTKHMLECSEQEACFRTCPVCRDPAFRVARTAAPHSQQFLQNACAERFLKVSHTATRRSALRLKAESEVDEPVVTE